MKRQLFHYRRAIKEIYELIAGLENSIARLEHQVNK